MDFIPFPEDERDARAQLEAAWSILADAKEEQADAATLEQLWRTVLAFESCYYNWFVSKTLFGWSEPRHLGRAMRIVRDMPFLETVTDLRASARAILAVYIGPEPHDG